MPNSSTTARPFSQTSWPLTIFARWKSVIESQSNGGAPAPGAVAEVQTQIESPSPSVSELLVGVGSGLENLSLNSTSVDRAADAVT